MPKVKNLFQHIVNSPKLFLVAAWTLFVFMLLAFGLFGCMTEQKAINHLKKKNALAQVCADNFPVKDSIATRETITFDTTATEQAIEDLLIEDIGGGANLVASPCKPVKQTTYITKTVRRDSITYQRDKAHETVLANQIAAKQDTLLQRDKTIAVKDEIIQQKDHKIKRLLKFITWLSLAIAALVIVVFRKQIGGLIQRLLTPLK